MPAKHFKVVAVEELVPFRVPPRILWCFATIIATKNELHRRPMMRPDPDRCSCCCDGHGAESGVRNVVVGSSAIVQK